MIIILGLLFQLFNAYFSERFITAKICNHQPGLMEKGCLIPLLPVDLCLT